MKKTIVITIALWLGVIAIFLLWNLKNNKKTHETIALKTGQVFFQQMVDTRAWNAHHAGVYVLITKETQPNPYLEDPKRDLTTVEGTKLTKINPAYMTRQIAEISSKIYGIQFHITSLKPIRPANKAENWEKKYLMAFEKGSKECANFFPDGSYRYMAPLVAKKSCLQCHAKQGYKEGEVRGGISVTIPEYAQKPETTLYTGYGIIATTGVIIILLGGSLLGKKQTQLLHANESLKTEKEKLEESIEQVKALSGIVPICMYCKEIRDDQGYWNQLEKFISEHSEAKFSHAICDKCLAEHHPETAAKIAKEKAEENGAESPSE